MDLMKNQLFYTRTLPYITKRHVNDALCKRTLSQLDRRFHARVYEAAKRALGGAGRAVVLQGDVAAAAYVDCEPPPHSVQLRLNATATTAANVASALPLRELMDDLRDVVREYRAEVDRILRTVELTELVGAAATSSSSPKIVVFKSYADQAYEFPPSNFVRLALNPDVDVKLTASTVNDDEYVLVRYSLNVHAVGDVPIWLHATHRRSPKRLAYVPLDLYFLDVRVVNGADADAVTREVFFFDERRLVAAVDSLDVVVAEQLERLLFDVFNFADGEMHERMRRLTALVAAADRDASWRHTKARRQFYRRAKQDAAADYTVRSVKEFLRGAGSRLGARLVIELYFMKRFRNDIGHITHQVNFPYHVWSPRYYSVCWKQYCRCLNALFDFSFRIN